MQFNESMTIKEFKNQFDNNDKIENISKIAHNTFDYSINNQRKIRYTNTDIVLFNKNYIILNTGGFYTNTTRNRLNNFLNHGHVYQSKNIWYYEQYQTKENEDTEEIRFFDGIKIDINTGNILNKDKAPKTYKIDKYNERLNKLIINYCDKVNKLKVLPDNSLDDCLYCSMFNNDHNFNEHLLLHLKEKYIMYSLIINALKYKGYNHPDFIYKMDKSKKDNRRQIINALKKYFRDKLIKR